MSLGIAFWIVMLIVVVLGAYWNWGTPAAVRNDFLLLVLLVLLGWKVFGAPLHG